MCVVLVYFFWTWDEGQPRKRVVQELNKARGNTWDKAKKLNNMNGRLEFEMEEQYNGEYQYEDTNQYDTRGYPDMETVEVNDRYYRDEAPPPRDYEGPRSPRDDYPPRDDYRSRDEYPPRDVGSRGYPDERPPSASYLRGRMSPRSEEIRFERDPRYERQGSEPRGNMSPTQQASDPRASNISPTGHLAVELQGRLDTDYDSRRNEAPLRAQSRDEERYNPRSPRSNNEFSPPIRTGREPEYRESVREDSYFPNSRTGGRAGGYERPEPVREIGNVVDINEEFDI